VEDLILQHGGKLSKQVSGVTDYLLAGEWLEDNRPAAESSKYRAAVEKKVPIISEAQLLLMIEKHAGVLAAMPPATVGPSVPSTAPSTVPSTVPAAPIRAITGLGGSSSGGGSRSASTADDLWVDKYKPQSSAQLIGSAELVRKLGDWLRNWDSVHLRHSLKVPFSKDNPGARAVLLSGPPGIGKSTVAGLAAKELGYDVMELNASDTRNSKQIEATLSSAVSSRAISGNIAQAASGRRLVIMDEVDGMGGSDRGGIAELIRVIKTSKIPIICICNDRQAQKIRSLVNHCFDLRVKRPTKQQIAQRMVQVAKIEGMELDPNAAEMLVEQSGNDIRQV
ncbi:P-loop containing nucleoside triphosphate hydrolase protein, partial [Ochromonadaceae sp. CCMP2298]